MNLQGIFAGAVPADLQAVINTIDGTTYNGFALMGIAGLGDSLNMDLNQYLTPEGLAVIDQVRNEACTFDAISRFGGVRDTSVWTLSGLTLKQLSGLDIYLHSALRESSLGEEGRHPDVLVLIASSITDDVILHRSNRQLSASYCRAGSQVSFYAATTPTHAGGALGTMPTGMTFLDQVFSGTPTSYDCAGGGGQPASLLSDRCDQIRFVATTKLSKTGYFGAIFENFVVTVRETWSSAGNGRTGGCETSGQLFCEPLDARLAGG